MKVCLALLTTETHAVPQGFHVPCGKWEMLHIFKPTDMGHKVTVTDLPRNPIHQNHRPNWTRFPDRMMLTG